MKITCQSCQSKYAVSDEKVQGKTVKIKCRKCGATIVVNSATASSSGTSPSSPPAAADGAYLVNVGDEDQRSMTLEEIVNAYNQQVVTGDTYVWSEGMGDWQPLGQVEAIVAALHGGAGAASSPPPEAEPLAASPVSESEAPRAAVRRDSGRRSADLFGAGAGLAAVAQAAPSTPPPMYNGNGAANGASGQRDENSVLFSLSALTAKAATAPSTSKTTATKDDSGLIDLKALAASASTSAAPATQAHVPDVGGALFPLGAPPTPASVHPPAGAAQAGAPQKSNAPIFIAVGGVVALAAIVGVFFLAKGGGDKTVPTAQPTVAVTAAAATVEPTATAAVTAAPTATADASAAASASASAKVAVKGPPGKNPGKAPGPGAAAAPPPPKPGGDSGSKPPPAKKGNCGCAPDDLMCAMSCSAKGH